MKKLMGRNGAESVFTNFQRLVQNHKKFSKISKKGAAVLGENYIRQK